MERIFDGLINLFHPFLYGPQTLDFIQDNSKNLIKLLEELPQKTDSLEFFLNKDFFYLNDIPFIPEEKNFLKYFECRLLFEKLKIKGLIIKKSVKEDNLIFWLQEFQKEEIKSQSWIKILREEDKKTLNLKYNFLNCLHNFSSLIYISKSISKNIEEGRIVSYAPLRERIQKIYESLSTLEERALCLLPFFSKEEDKFIPFLILNYVFFNPLGLSSDLMEDILFAGFFYEMEEKKNWVPLLQSKNFSNGGFLAFLASCNHPNLAFTLFYITKKYLEFYFSERGIFKPFEALEKITKLEDISEDLKDYAVSILGKIPPSSPALTEECEPCLVISKKEIAIYQENKFILKEGKAEKPVPFEQFPFNPLYVILNLEES